MCSRSSTNARPSASGSWRRSLPPCRRSNRAPTRPCWRKRADSIYQLQKGADFSLLARQVSDDKLTHGNRGELPEFGSGRYQPSFENKCLNLPATARSANHSLTEFGYHIIKRIMHTPVTTDKDDAAYAFELKQKILQDARVNVAKDLFLKEIQKQISFKRPVMYPTRICSAMPTVRFGTPMPAPETIPSAVSRSTVSEKQRSPARSGSTS